jgi:hypothetical protein
MPRNTYGLHSLNIKAVLQQGFNRIGQAQQEFFYKLAVAHLVSLAALTAPITKIALAHP